MGRPPPDAVDAAGAGVRYGTARGWWVIAGTVLGSGIAFLDGTIVNVALPAISKDLGTSFSGLQWIVDGYLVTLSSLLLLGGSLGDRYGRRSTFVAGLVWFTTASVLCAAAPSSGFLIAARAIQGVGGALLVPGSLSIIAATFHPDDRARAIGAWSGLAGVTSSIGPFLGGWMIDAFTWRLVFIINVPLAALAVAIALRHVPETRAPARKPLDVGGSLLVTAALGGISYAAITHHGSGSVVAGLLGAVALVAFVEVELRSTHPILPLSVFRSRQFTGTNLTTLAVYAALSGALFLIVIRLQVSLGYSALEAGGALVPFSAVMLVLSPRAGQLGQRVGARLPMTVGPLVAAGGLLLFSRLGPGYHYVSGVLPAVLLFSLGMSLTVAPLTAAVLGSVNDAMTGVASGVNNAVARVAGLLAVATLPALAGISSGHALAASLQAGYGEALRISAAVCAAGGAIAALVVRSTTQVHTVAQPSPFYACHDEHLVKR